MKTKKTQTNSQTGLLPDGLYAVGEVQVKEIRFVNIPLPTQYVETRWQLPKGCKRFTIHCRDGTAVQVAFQPGQAAGNPPAGTYFTILANTSWWEDNLDIQNEDVALYFACASNAKVVEIAVGL